MVRVLLTFHHQRLVGRNTGPSLCLPIYSFHAFSLFWPASGRHEETLYSEMYPQTKTTKAKRCNVIKYKSILTNLTVP